MARFAETPLRQSRTTKPRPALQSIRFPAGANVAQASGLDALAWAKYQCPSHARVFKGMADDKGT
jgi:hypothetical protein